MTSERDMIWLLEIGKIKTEKQSRFGCYKVIKNCSMKLTHVELVCVCIYHCDVISFSQPTVPPFLKVILTKVSVYASECNWNIVSHFTQQAQKISGWQFKFSCRFFLCINHFVTWYINCVLSQGPYRQRQRAGKITTTRKLFQLKTF